MLPRFSFLNNIPYDKFVLQNRWMMRSSSYPDTVDGLQHSIIDVGRLNTEATLASSRMVSDSVFASGEMVSQSVTDSAQETISALGDSTQILSEKLQLLQLTQLFGSLLQVGATAISTYFITRELKETRTGIERLGAQFSEGMSLLAGQLDIQTKAIDRIKNRLDAIHETLKSPTVTKANEWRNIGLERFEQGLFPEANRALVQAIKFNETDPLCYLMLGKIYLDGVDSKTNLQNYKLADLCFNRAEKYSKATLHKAPDLIQILTEAMYFESNILFITASQQRLNKEDKSVYSQTILNSLKKIEELLTLDSKYPQALYLKTKILLLFGKYQEALNIFMNLAEIDVSFISTAYNDFDFTGSKLGQTLLSAVKIEYINILTPEIRRFFSIVAECDLWEIEVPETMLEWKKKLGWSTLEEALYQLNHQTENLIKSGTPIGTILKYTNNQLTAIIAGKQEQCKAEIAELNQQLKKLNKLERQYFDTNWYSNNKVIKSSHIYSQDLQIDPEKINNRSDYVYHKDKLEKALLDCEAMEIKINQVKSVLESAKVMHSKFVLKRALHSIVSLILGAIVGFIAFVFILFVIYSQMNENIGASFLLALFGAIVSAIYTRKAYINSKFNSSESILFLTGQFIHMNMSQDSIDLYVSNFREQ